MRYITEGSGRKERRLANKKISGDIAHMKNGCVDPATPHLHAIGDEILRIEGFVYHFSHLAYLSFTLEGPYTLVALLGVMSWMFLGHARHL